MDARKNVLRKLYYYKALGFVYANENILKQNFEIKANSCSFDELKSQVLNCELCELCKSKKHSLFSHANLNAKVFFVAQFPSVADDLNGKFFSAKSGEIFLNAIKESLNFGLDDFYFANLIKCHAQEPVNLDYFKQCSPYILQEIDIVSPKIIVALGKSVFSLLMNDFSGNFASARGGIFKFKNTFIMPTYSPFWIVTNPSKFDEFKADLRKIKEFL